MAIDSLYSLTGVGYPQLDTTGSGSLDRKETANLLNLLGRWILHASIRHIASKYDG